MNKVHPLIRVSLRSTKVAIAFAAVSLLTTARPPRAGAVDTGIGRSAAAVANIDPASAVAGSTELRSFPGQEADTGMVQVFRFENGQTATVSAPVALVNGTYAIALSPPLSSGENIYVQHTTNHAASTTLVVQSQAAPSISGPVDPGTLTVFGHATPGRLVTIEDAISGATLGSGAAAPGSGGFAIAVSALRIFQAIRAVDDEDLSSSVVTILGFLPVTNAGIPPPTCNPVVVQAAAPQIIRFECGLLNPRGIAVLPDGTLRILAGVPPSNLLNYPPPATIRFVPDSGSLEYLTAQFLSPVTGVGAVYDSISGHLFIARPHLFRLQDEHMVERHDGEILEMNPSDGETTVATRILDIAPTGITADTSGMFGGGAIVSSLFFDVESGPLPYPVNPTEAAASAIWSATLTAVAPLTIATANPEAPLTRIQGLAVGADWDATPALFAAQPGSGTIFRITQNSGSYSATPLLSGLGSPLELAFGPPGPLFGGALYATDPAGGRILKITIGAGGSSTVQNYVTGLNRPFGLAFSNNGLFVTEYAGNIVAIYP